MTRPRRGHAGAVWRIIHLGRTPCNAAPSPEGILVVPARCVAQTLAKVPILVTFIPAAATLLFSGCLAFFRFSDLAPAPTFAACYAAEKARVATSARLAITVHRACTRADYGAITAFFRARRTGYTQQRPPTKRVPQSGTCAHQPDDGCACAPQCICLRAVATFAAATLQKQNWKPLSLVRLVTW